MEDMEVLDPEESYPDEIPETETEDSSGEPEHEDSPGEDEAEDAETGLDEPDTEAEDPDEEESEADAEDPDQEESESDTENPRQEPEDSETGSYITVSGNVVVFPDGYDAALPAAYSSEDSEAVIQAVAEQTDVLRGGFFAAAFVLGIILGVVLVNGFRLRRV